jgi:hypothetical protein
LRDWECGRFDIESRAEIECGWAERQLGGGGPEVKLIAAPVAEEAVEEVSLKMHGEAAIALSTAVV